MYEIWGTNKLSTDYGCFQKKAMLREINHDEIVPKKHNFEVQNEVHKKIRNDDDWEYGT
jgi:hypothetical protein